MRNNGKVYLQEAAFFDMIAHCLHRGNPSLGIRLEVQGYLVGYTQGLDVIVTQAIPIKHGSPAQVQLQGEDYVIAAEILIERMKGKEYVIGWYHSHPNLSLFLSHDDKQTQSGMQGPNPACIAIVVDPYVISKLETDPTGEFIECFRLDDPFAGTLSYHTVPLVLPQPSLTSFLSQILKWVTQNSLGLALSPEACENKEERELSQALRVLYCHLTEKKLPESSLIEELGKRISSLEAEISNLKQQLKAPIVDESKLY